MKKKNSEFDNFVENANQLPVAESTKKVLTGHGTYKVCLPGLPSMEIEAEDELYAKALYDKYTGVLATSQQHEIEKIA